MRRGDYSPLEFGVDLTRETLMDLMVDEFSSYYKGQLSFDELLLRPREAVHSCEHVRHKHMFFDLPDDIILRSICKIGPRNSRQPRSHSGWEGKRRR